MVKKCLLLIILLLFIGAETPVYANTSSGLVKLDEISDKALEMAKLKRYDDSEKMLKYFSLLFLEIKADHTAMNMDELRIISAAHQEALDAVADTARPDTEKINAVTKFRLAVDALESSHQPLWTEMEDRMMAAFNQTEDALQKKDTEELQTSLSDLLNQYELIYPSLKVDLSKETIQQLDTRIQFLHKYRPQLMDDKNGQKEMAQLHSDFQVIFDEMGKDETDPSLWWVIISTGSIIIMTLSYVGWRKYNGDQRKDGRARKGSDR
ncbi:sporulation protein YpjB [Bacillus massiliglaciei]|uniref:sporulation protein YpjB n=1 Tax=Bacillus massiliglaciei TaxID=1816693 RepID=UPI000DA60A1C|nr:sporulation protein YpjB [Bacillus massiliglaciei]